MTGASCLVMGWIDERANERKDRESPIQWTVVHFQATGCIVWPEWRVGRRYRLVWGEKESVLGVLCLR